MARVEKDFVELLRLFNKYRVRYCVVGAFATGFHAIPRYTKDMDILVEPSGENGQKIVQALEEFGFGSLNLKPEDFDREGRFVQMGYEPVRIDVTTSIEGVTFGEAWKGRKSGDYGGEKTHFIGLKELIKNKKKAGRKQDIADLEILQNAMKKKKS